MPRLNAYLLGAPRFEHATTEVAPPSRKATALLTFLAIEGRQPRDEVCALLWGPGRLQNLRQELHVLRQLPGSSEWLVTERSEVEVRAETDVSWLRQAGVDGEDPARWWRGEPALGLEQVRAPAFVEWLEHLRSELTEVRVDAAVVAARRALDRDDDDGAWAMVEPLLTEVAHDDRVWRAAIEIRLRQDRPSDAVALLDQAERRFELVARPAWSPLLERLRTGAVPSRRSLPAAAREVLQVLAISDEPLAADVVLSVVDRPDLELARAMQLLRDGGWLTPAGRVPPGVRDDVRAELAPQVAQVLHGRLAEALREADVPPGRIATHLEAAGRPSSATYLAEARRSGSEPDLAHAVRTATTAAERCHAFAEGVRLTSQRGDADRALDWWRQLEDAAVRSQDPVGLRQTAVLGALLVGRAGDLPRAHLLLDDAVLLVGEADPAIAVVRGALRFFAGRPEEARPLLVAGLATADVDLRLLAVNALGALAGLAGDTAEADRLHREALALARRERRLRLVMMLLNNLAATAQRRGDLEAALERYSESARLADELNDVQMQGAVAYNEAHALIELGQLGRARHAVRRLLATPLRQPRLRGLGCRGRADLERSCGRFEEAAAWSARAQSAFDEAGDAAHALASRFNGAQARFLAGGAAEALDEMRDSLARLVVLGRRDLVPAGRAELALCTPDIAEARSLVEAEPRSPREWAAAQRLALWEGRGLVPGITPHLGTGRAFVGSYLDALAARALRDEAPERSQQLRVALRHRVAAGAQGLLTAQREALDERVKHWLTNPAAHW